MTRRRIFARIKRGPFEREENFGSGRDAACWEEMVNETLDLLERLTMPEFDIRTYAEGLADSIRTFGGLRTRAAWLSGGHALVMGAVASKRRAARNVLAPESLSRAP